MLSWYTLSNQNLDWLVRKNKVIADQVLGTSVGIYVCK